MNLTNIDPNTNERESRTSDISGPHQKRECNTTTNQHVKSDMSSTAPGVLSMLKTTTESGGIGTLPLSQTWHPKINHGPPRRHNGPTPSRTSSHYSRTGSFGSRTSGNSLQDYSTREELWPYTHLLYTKNQELNNSTPDIRLLSGQENIVPLLPGALDRPEADRRTHSLTQNSYQGRHLTSHRSVSSLRSQGPPPSIRTSRNYPPRLRRPAIRPSSPALSDSVAASSIRTVAVRSRSNLQSHASTPIHPAQSGRFQPQRSLQGYNFPSAPTSSPNHTLNGIYDPLPGVWRGGRNMVTHDSFLSSQRMQPSQQPQTFNSILARPAQPFKPCPSPLSVEQTNTLMSTPQPQRRTDSTPYAGFVQRVKDILEEKATPPEYAIRIPRYDSPNYMHDLPRHISELPGTPVRNRLTREMIKAAIGPSSEEGVLSSPDAFHPVIFNNHAAHSSDEYSSSKAQASLDSEQAKSTPERYSNYKQPESDDATSPSSSIKSVNQSTQGLARKDLSSAIPDSQMERFEVSSTGQEFANIPSPSPWISRNLSVIPERSSDHPSSPINVSGDGRVLQSDPTSIPAVDCSSVLQKNKVGEEREEERLDPVIETGDGALEEDPSMHDSGVAAMVTSQSFDTSTHAIAQSHSDDDLLSSEFEVAKVVRIPKIPLQSPNLPGFDPATGSHSAPADTQVFTRPDSVSVSPVDGSTHKRLNRRHSTRDSLTTERGDNTLAVYHSGGSTTDIRTSVVKQFQFPLSDVTEDSQEDASTTNLRMLGAKAPVLRGNGPRNAKFESKAAQRVVRQSSELSRSYLPRQISHTKGIPSFHFSRHDLTTKLNVALGVRNSMSLENLSSKRKQNRFGSTLERSESSLLLHDRYKSFFSDVEDTEPGTESGEAAASTAITDESGHSEETAKRKEIISEIERLSIPSVNGLTMRLSEFFPLLSDLNEATKSEDGVPVAAEQSGAPQSSKRLEIAPNTLASVISAGAAAKTRRRSGATNRDDESEETLDAERMPLRLMKDLPPLPQNESQTRTSNSIDESRAIAKDASTLSKDKPEALSELEATVPIEMDSKSAGKPAEWQAAQPPNDVNKLCSEVITVPDGVWTRPWNKQQSYPWSDDAPYIGINLPGHLQYADGSPVPRSRLSRSRVFKSADTLNDEDELRIARSMSPGPHAEKSLIPKSNEVSTDSERPELMRKGIIGSLQRKMGLKPRIDRSGFAIDPAFLHPEERVTEPGDRYPTSGLTPPAGLNIEVENRSYFSDDSSEGSRQARASQTLKKRLTRLRSKRPASRPLSPRPSQAESNHKTSLTATAVNGGSVFDDSQPDVRTSNSNEICLVNQEEEKGESPPPVGMSKVEFRAKMVMHRLRKLWYRSGFLLRSMSRNKKQ